MKSCLETAYPYNEPIALWELLKITDEEYEECVALRRAGLPLSAPDLATQILDRLNRDPQETAFGNRHLVDLAELGLTKQDYEAIFYAILEQRTFCA